jgi:hypothetical protein
MAIAATVSGIECVKDCYEIRELDDPAFLDFVIDLLVTQSGVSLASITSANLRTAVDNALCTLQDRQVFSVSSPLKKKAIVLYLLSQNT